MRSPLRGRRRRARERGAARWPILRSIRTRLAVTFFLVTALSVAVIYVVVAPPLSSALIQQRIKDLETVVLNSNGKPRGRIHTAFEDLLRVRVDPGPKGTAIAATIVGTLHSITLNQVNVVDIEFSGKGNQAPLPQQLGAAPQPHDNATIDTFATTVTPGQVRPGTLGNLALLGIVISPTKPDQTYSRVVVFSSSLSDVSGDVGLVRSRILLAAALGLLVALLTGALVARALTRRVLRLETTAARVARGDFEAHFSDSSGDELGQLARALANMQSQLEGLDAGRRRFIATASHELRTPIFSLGGFLELLEDEALDEQTRAQFLGQVREQVDRLGKLATQLLDLSRLESGTVEMQPSITDLGVLARAVSAEFAPALARHDSDLEVRIPHDPVRVRCDSERVAQLLRILIDNALAHTPAGTGVIVAAHAPENGTGAQLLVRDSGPGIPQEALARVFEPFYSADGARGAGLGLAIARELAVRMDAELAIDSEPGETTFTLTLAPSGG